MLPALSPPLAITMPPPPSDTHTHNGIHNPQSIHPSIHTCSPAALSALSALSVVSVWVGRAAAVCQSTDCHRRARCRRCPPPPRAVCPSHKPLATSCLLLLPPCEGLVASSLPNSQGPVWLNPRRISAVDEG